METLNCDPESAQSVNLASAEAVPLPPSPPATDPAIVAAYLLREEAGLSRAYGQIHKQDNDYGSSLPSTQQFSSNSSNGTRDDDDSTYLDSRASSHSSTSPVDASIFVHPDDGIKLPVVSGGYDVLKHPWINSGDADDGISDVLGKPIGILRQRETAFRNPSSVKAMQMHTEDEGDGYLTPLKHQDGQHNSDIAWRSVDSQLKTPSYYLPSRSGSKLRASREYPLVLLHCNLLAPSLSLPDGMGPVNPKMLKELLPPQYWRRWRLLMEKVGSSVIRDRGVLISHPQDAYDVLEERLLESLELQRPRLDRGHFFGQETDSEKDDCCSKEEEATDDERSQRCPDCGGQTARGWRDSRKWEIKIFAANGLMRADAWTAAWREMEKVDAQVNLWLPAAVRLELEEKLLEDAKIRDESNDSTQAQERRESASENGHYDSVVKRFDMSAKWLHEPLSTDIKQNQQTRPKTSISSCNKQPIEDIDLRTLIINYIRVLANDRRNIIMSVLGVVTLFLAIRGRPDMESEEFRHFPRETLDSNLVMERSTVHHYHSALNWESLASPTACSSETYARVTAEAVALSTTGPPCLTTGPTMSNDLGLLVVQEEVLNEHTEPARDTTVPEVIRLKI